MIRTRQSRKINLLRDQLRTSTEATEQERYINDHSLQVLRDELEQVKLSLAEISRRESQVLINAILLNKKFCYKNCKNFQKNANKCANRILQKKLHTKFANISTKVYLQTNLQKKCLRRVKLFILSFDFQLQSFRVSVTKILSEPLCTPDYELIAQLQKIVAAHREFTMLSRRYDVPLESSPSRCTR